MSLRPEMRKARLKLDDGAVHNDTKDPVQRVVGKPAEIDEGITVAEAARIIGCDQTTVRELVRRQQLEGWYVGKHRRKEDGGVTEPRGVRVSRASCFDYRERNAIGQPLEMSPTPRRPRRDSAILAETVASLRKLGVRV